MPQISPINWLVTILLMTLITIMIIPKMKAMSKTNLSQRKIKTTSKKMSW